MTTHAEARAFAARALTRLFGHEPTPGAIKALAGVACLETSYGDGWKGAGKGSNNMGAIQAGRTWQGEVFSYVDTHPNADGTSTPYRIDFRRYATPEDGWQDLASVVFVNRGRSSVLYAADNNDWRGVSTALHATGYYEGYGRTVADRVANHCRALTRSIAAADGATAPKLPAQRRTIWRGNTTAPETAELQRELRIAADGRWGDITDQALEDYQRAHGLTPDRRCGQLTWATLLGDDYIPEAT